MKKKLGISVIFIVIAGIIYSNCFWQIKNTYYFELLHAGETMHSKSVVLSSEKNDKEEIYALLDSALKKYSGNLYCLGVGEDDTYTKYVLSYNTKPFDTLPLKKGHFFKKSDNAGEKYLSTDNLNDKNCIGVINTFGRGVSYRIKTLKSYFDNNSDPLNKTYTIDFKDANSFNSFKEEINNCGIAVTVSNNEPMTSMGETPSFFYFAIIATVVLSLVILYDLILSSKKIGIEKMMGFDSLTIWRSRAMPIIATEILIFVLFTCISSLILLDDFNILVIGFLKKLFIYYFVIIAITLVMISIPFVYIGYISIDTAIKNRKPLKAILQFNNFIKILVNCVFIVIIISLISQVNSIWNLKNDKYNNWEKIKNYAYISSWRIDNDSCWSGETQEDYDKFKQLYCEINKNGGIYADFEYFSPKYEKEFNETDFIPRMSVSVNPNYLKTFPVKDENEKNISVSENETAVVVLVPLKYKKYESDIMEYYSSDFAPSGDVKIIWTQNNQSCFTMLVDTAIDNYNMIRDPILWVLTENNAENSYYAISAERDFKIPVKDHKDSQPEIDAIYESFFDKNDVAFISSSVYQAVEDGISESNNKITVCLVLIVIITLTEISVILQNIITYIEYYKKTLAIKKFMGYRFASIYMGFFADVILCYLGSSVIAFFVTRRIEVIWIALIIFAVDYIISNIFIKIKDRQNVLRIAKGG